jgi:hypothetical protein
LPRWLAPSSLWQRLLGAASVRVWHITSRRWGPWTERPLPEVVRVAYPPAQLASYAFKSNDIVVSTYREMSHFRFTATVEPDGPRMYRLTMASDQIDGAGFFAFCIAAYATAKAGYARYVMGTKLPKQKVMGESSLVFPTLLRRKGEKPEAVGPPGYEWGQILELENPVFRDSCSRMLIPEYLW